MQCGPSASWPVVLVPIAGPLTTTPVSTVTSPLPRNRDREAVHSARCRASLLLADAVVLRPVTRALEPLAADALRHTTAEVGAFLVERHDAGAHAGEDQLGVDRLGLRDRVGRIGRDPGAGLRRVEEAAAGGDPRLDVVDVADRHLATEATGLERPEERHEARRRERGDAGGHQRHGGAVEEHPPADADRLGVGRHPRRERRRFAAHQRRAGACDDTLRLGLGRVARDGLDRTGGTCGAVALAGLRAERAGAAHVGAARQRDERDHPEHDDDGDGDHDDAGGVHAGDLLSCPITARRTGRLATAG